MKTDLRDIEASLPDAHTLLALMGQDKKVVGGEIRFILVRGIGSAFVTGDVPQQCVINILEQSLKR